MAGTMAKKLFCRGEERRSYNSIWSIKRPERFTNLILQVEVCWLKSFLFRKIRNRANILRNAPHWRNIWLKDIPVRDLIGLTMKIAENLQDKFIEISLRRCYQLHPNVVLSVLGKIVQSGALVTHRLDTRVDHVKMPVGNGWRSRSVMWQREIQDIRPSGLISIRGVGSRNWVFRTFYQATNYCLWWLVSWSGVVHGKFRLAEEVVPRTRFREKTLWRYN